MPKCIIYTDPITRTVEIVHPAYQDMARDRSLTDDQFLNMVAAKDVPVDVTYQVIDQTTIPTDRTNRDLWKEEPGGIDTSVR